MCSSFRPTHSILVSFVVTREILTLQSLSSHGWFLIHRGNRSLHQAVARDTCDFSTLCSFASVPLFRRLQPCQDSSSSTLVGGIWVRGGICYLSQRCDLASTVRSRANIKLAFHGVGTRRDQRWSVSFVSFWLFYVCLFCLDRLIGRDRYLLGRELLG